MSAHSSLGFNSLFLRSLKRAMSANDRIKNKVDGGHFGQGENGSTIRLAQEQSFHLR